jgi:hypothetical protein
VVRVAIDIHSELQILIDSAWYCSTPHLQLQPDSGPGWNWYTLRVANIERFRPILCYPFSCNLKAVRVANSEVATSTMADLQPGAQPTHWSARRVAIEVLSVLQLECLLSYNLSDKNYKIYTSRLATEAFEELQLKCFPSCNRSAYWVAIEMLLKSCNWSGCRVATRVLVELQFLW